MMLQAGYDMACLRAPLCAGKRAKVWWTFNEPGVAAMCGWISGNHPPGHLLRFRVRSAGCACLSRPAGACWQTLAVLCRARYAAHGRDAGCASQAAA